MKLFILHYQVSFLTSAPNEIPHIFTHSPCPRAGVAQHTRPSRTTKASPAHLGPIRCLRGHFLARLSAPRRYFIFAADSTLNSGMDVIFQLALRHLLGLPLIAASPSRMHVSSRASTPRGAASFQTSGCLPCERFSSLLAGDAITIC